MMGINNYKTTKMKKALILFVIFLSFAMQNREGIDRLNKTVKTSFWVNGNCEMCQARIQKAALEVKGVKMAHWTIDSKVLTVLYNDKKCSVDDIKKNIAKVGHDTIGFSAPNEVYENLHACCQYDRDDRP